MPPYADYAPHIYGLYIVYMPSMRCAQAVCMPRPGNK